MTDKTNPFPAYPVVRLRDDPREVLRNTILTEAVSQSRDRLGRYIELWQGKASDVMEATDPLVIRIQGDYGTGKTHLLLDAAAQFERELLPQFPDATVIRVACLDSDPIEWFRQSFGPELKRSFLKNTVVRLYALAGQHVAESAELTRPAAAKLNEDYRLIYKFIKEDVLNTTAVAERFQVLLTTICPEASADVGKALGGLFWEQTEAVATKWLTGELLSTAEAEKLRLPLQLSSDQDAAGILIAVAAIQNYLSSPFGVMIDELEHLTRRDESVGSKRNITWLKRLVEGLAKYFTLVYVSGHDSAWGPYSDFFDRFSQYKPITLRRWTAEDILKLVIARVPEATTAGFGAAQAEQIAAITGGNVRRIVAICRTLFRETSGFDKAVDQTKISQVAEAIGQTISIGEATERIREIAEGAGLTVQAGGVLVTKETNPKKLQFDLVGFKGDEPRLLVEFKHAFDQRLMGDLAKRFIAQVMELVGSYPELVGCFVVDGSVDDEVLGVLRSDQRLRVLSFDLTQRDAIIMIERHLTARLKQAEEISPEAARLKDLQDQNMNIEGRIEEARRDDNQELIQRLQAERKDLESQVQILRTQLGASSRELEQELTAIEERRKSELEDLYRRLEQLSTQMSSQRDIEIVAPQEQEVTARLQTTYTDLTKPLPLSSRLRLTLNNIQAGIGIFGILIGLVAFFLSDAIAEYRFPYKSAVSYQYQSYYSGYLGLKYGIVITAFILTFGGLFILWRRFAQIESYLEYTTGMLREVYLQSPDPMTLVRVSNILRDSLTEAGPVYGKHLANKRLAQGMPYFFDYLKDGTTGSLEKR